MKTVEHRTGTVHAVKETVVESDGRGNYKTECGRWAYGDGSIDHHLESFPEDFGSLSEDCQQCAKAVDA